MQIGTRKSEKVITSPGKVSVFSGRRAATGVALFLLTMVGVQIAWADATQTSPGELRTYATIHSIGIEWNLTGDSNHNAECTVAFRKKGDAAWQPASPLLRVDYAWYYGTEKARQPANMLAGSIMFLSPNTEYEVQLVMKDQDGGKDTKSVFIRTRPIPVIPQSKSVYYVVPGNAGGSGSSQNPFQGIAAAQAVARPGDIFLLKKGEYGEVTLEKAGEEGGKYIVWKAAGDGVCLFRKITIGGSYNWLEGLHLQMEPAKSMNGIVTKGAVIGAVISRCNLNGFHYGIWLNGQCRDWHITDNTIVGDKDSIYSGNKAPKDAKSAKIARDAAISGEGIELGDSIGGHVVCYNSITRVADGVSYPGRDTDIYGNEIFDVTDDGLEPDRGSANIRMWGNRITDVGAYGLSFQPMECGPWYFIRNQLVAGSKKDANQWRPGLFKLRVQDRFVLINNTMVAHGMISPWTDEIFTSFSRNNLFISATGKKPFWVANDRGQSQYGMALQKPGWMTDVDYNGYDWGSDPADRKSAPAFHYGDRSQPTTGFNTLAEFAAATGTEKNSRRVSKEAIFDSWKISPEPGPTPVYNLTLVKTGDAVDCGSPVPNLSGPLVGKAPDLGAWELGRPLMYFGPRAGAAAKEHELYWAFY